MKLAYLPILTAWLCLALHAEHCSAIQGIRIMGRDVAAAVPELADLPAEADLAAAPLAGVARVFHNQELARIAREYALPPPNPASEVCFVRKTMVLTPERLLPVIKHALPVDRLRLSSGARFPGSEDEPGTSDAKPVDVKFKVEILDYSHSPVPEGMIEFPRGSLAASGIWRGRVVTGDGRNAPIWARVKVTDAVTGAPVPLGPEAEAREVNRGDPVRVEVASGHALIVFDSIAESSGRKGEMVLVATPDKRRRLLTRVEDKGRVSISR